MKSEKTLCHGCVSREKRTPIGDMHALTRLTRPWQTTFDDTWAITQGAVLTNYMTIFRAGVIY
jgi:hypothetical protein